MVRKKKIGKDDWITYVRVDEISAMGHKMIRVVHVATFLYPYEMLGRIEAAFAASAGQKLFHRHVLLQIDRGRLVK